jgi:chromosome segregation protein
MDALKGAYVDTSPKAGYTRPHQMRLKRLELQGYKSFASRTEFVFPTGITAIVGPNGSGKSNIADAIRWALGEQSLRMLRGKTTRDMMFSGGRRRAQAGMAEVLLTLDNADGWLPVDFTEVTIGRRAYRSGESEYLLGGSRVRLRDLTDVLGESGLSQRTYTVIGQGLVDAALSLRPQERRALFEEAAGIAVYRARREEAVARLEETGRNLERVHDILGEIAPRLKRLEEQAARFAEHQRIAAHLNGLQRTWYGFHWGQAQEMLWAAQQRTQSLEDGLASRQADADRVVSGLVDLRRQQTELRGRLRDAYRRTADLHDQADAAQRELAALTERGRLLAAQRDEILEQLEPLLVQRDAQAELAEKVQGEVQELQRRVADRRARVAALEEELEELRRRAQERSDRRAKLERELADLRTRRQEREARASEAGAALTRLEAEQELLSRMREEAAGFAEGTRLLLRAGMPGVQDLLSRLIQVREEWERAVEAALGPRVQALLVRDWEAVEESRKAVGSGGRAVLVPLSDVRPQPWEPEDRGEVTALTLRAADVVSCEERLRPVVGALLGRTLLVKDLATARSLLSHLPPGGQCVTRDGEVVGADGAVTVGTGGAVLAQERAWLELPERLEAARRRREEEEAEAVRAAQEQSALETVLQESERAAAEVSARVTQAESGPLTQARTELAVARQALESQQGLLQRELTDLERSQAQLSARKARADELEAERTAAEERAARLREQTARFEQEVAQERAGIGPAEEELSRLAQEQEQAEVQERRAHARVRRMEERVNRAQLEVARRQDRLTRLQERIQEELGLVELEVADQVTAQAPLPLRPLVSSLPVVEALPEGLEEEIQRLKSRLRQLGPVNPDAPQDYDEALQRHDFLSAQVADLEAASARLGEVIVDLDQMMEQAFRETFEAVAGAFEEAFERLFSGGSGRLELTDPSDLAETGVDIIARPPGKRTQSLALLSGGERALTAAALIFAILRVRPTPFCVLDEVDAMLDEANVVRFRALLEELSEQTQFIVITHNRGTVEAADTVYGVSMGSEGVSQVVSLRLDGEKVGAQ